MAGKAKGTHGFGKKLKDQQVTNKELYNVAGGVPIQASSSIVAGGSQGAGTYQNAQGADIFMNTYDIVDVDRLKFAVKEGAGDILAVTDYGIEALYFGSDAYGLHYRVPSAKQHIFSQGSDIVFSINTDEILFGLPISVYGYEDIFNITEPDSPPANYRRIFSDSSNSDNLSVKRSDGTVIDLEEQTQYLSETTTYASGNTDLDGTFGDTNGSIGIQFNSDSSAGNGKYRIWIRANGAWYKTEAI